MKLAVDQIRQQAARFVRHGGAFAWIAPNVLQAPLAHRPFDCAACHTNAFAFKRSQLARIDRKAAAAGMEGWIPGRGYW